MSFATIYGRDRRDQAMFNPQYHIANYMTDIHNLHPKTEMKSGFGDEIYLNNIHFIPDPLKKNLADTLITEQRPEKPKKTPEMSSRRYSEGMDSKKPDLEVKMAEFRSKTVENRDLPSHEHSALSGITNFFSGVFSMLSSAMFRPKSPVTYYDCTDQGSVWQTANIEPDKNGFEQSGIDATDMSFNKSVAQCESKINTVKFLLSKDPAPTTQSWRKRPKKVFVSPQSVEESFEDAFTPDDFVSVPNNMYTEYQTIKQTQNCELFETDSPKIKTEMGPELNNTEKTELATTIEITDSNKLVYELEVNNKTVIQENEKQNTYKQNESENNSECDKTLVVSSCEDKLLKLKALLHNRKKCLEIPPETVPEPSKMEEQSKVPTKCIPINKLADKRFKNPHRTGDRRRKSKIKLNIEEDMLFANEISSDDGGSFENSPSTYSVDSVNDILPTITEGEPKEYFDEVCGRFNPGSVTDSEDSFQIVFTDSPKVQHVRSTSECDSEDSFIVFEDSPDSCYTSNDVFGDSGDESDSDVSDSGCNLAKLSHFSRTVSDLTDDSLFANDSEDEVDCSVRTICEPVSDVVTPKCHGLLLDERRKILRKEQPAKKVHFSSAPPKVQVMRVWAFAARQARAGHWERCALDRERFKRRIADVDMAVSWVLKPQHRTRVMFQRIRPWWNELRRREIAEKKEKEDEEKRQEAEVKESNEEDKEIGESKSVDKTVNVDELANPNEINDEIKSVNDIICTERDNSIDRNRSIVSSDATSGNEEKEETLCRDIFEEDRVMMKQKEIDRDNPNMEKIASCIS